MKKLRQLTAYALSAVLMTAVLPARAEEGADYSDYVPGDMPANLINSYQNVDWATGNGTANKYIEKNTQRQITLAEGKTINGANWSIMGADIMCGALSSHRTDGTDQKVAISLDYLSPGTTYVLKTKVKKAAVDVSEGSAEGTARFNIAIAGDQAYSGHSKAVYSNEYTNGMEVTSTEFTDFASTITIPTTWSTTQTRYETGQNIFIGMQATSTAPSGVIYTVTPGANTFYLAEEKPYSIKVSGDESAFNHTETLDLSCEVLNQIGIAGKLTQTFKWYAVDADRSAVCSSITVTPSADTKSATVSAAESTPYGKYYVIAESTAYAGMRKGFEIEVKKPPLVDYTPGTSTGMSTNYIQASTNADFAQASNSSIITYDRTAREGYVSIKAKSDISSAVEGLQIKNIGSYGFKSDFNFEAGKTYLVTAKVKSNDEGVYFNAMLSNKDGDKTALTNEYGSAGMLLTKDWQTFKASLTVPANYDPDKDKKTGKKFILGFNSATASGKTADIELSVSFCDVSVEDILLEAKKTVLGADDSMTAEAKIVNNAGTNDGCEQNFEWYLLDSEKVNKTDALKIKVSEDTKTATVLTDIYSEPGTYYLVAQSKDYDKFVKSVKFTVDKPDAKTCVLERLKTEEQTALSGKIEEYMGVMGVAISPANVDYDIVTKLLINERANVSDSDMTAFLEKAAVISAYKNPSGLWDKEGKFVYDGVLNLKALDKDGVTVYSLYSDEITDEGRAALQSALAGEYTSVSDFEKAFAVQVILKTLEYPKKSGTGVAELILTDKNAAAAELDISEYSELSDKAEAAEYLLKKSFTKQTLESAIKNIDATIAAGKKPSGTGGHTGSSGGSGGSGSSVTIAPSTPINNENTSASGDEEKEMFSDVGEEHWAYRDIYYLNKINVLSGDGEGRFNPDKAVTREQFVKMICEAFDYELTSAETEFSDVLSGAWYEKYIAAAVARGIITGTGADTFGVGRQITREDMCVIINRALGENSAGDLEGSLSDIDEVSVYAKDSVIYLNSIGVINGFSDGSFRPKNECTRAQAAKIICTILNLKGEA